MITIVIPVYNRASLIKRTIDNILDQTYQDIEIVVSDDGSTDNIEAVMQTISDLRVRFLKSEKNMGACHARNMGIEAARGEYIAFQDSDDLWDTHKLQKQLDALKAGNADVCICRMKFVYENGIEKQFHDQNFVQKDITLENELSNNFISTQLVLGRKECFIQEKFDERFPRFQDWDLGIRLVKNYSIVFLDDILAFRMVQEDSLSRNAERGYEGGKLLLEKYKEDFKRFPKAEADFLCFYSQFQELHGESSRANLRRSLKQKFTKKTFLKYISQTLGIYRFYLKRKRK